MSGAPREVTILGATGSIGEQALEVIGAHPERFRVRRLAAGGNAGRLVELVDRHRPEQVAVADEEAARAVRAAVDGAVEVLAGAEGVTALAAAPADVVLNGIVGSRGLRATLAALEAGNRLALANKESLVLGGPLVLDAARQAAERAGVAADDALAYPLLVPVDSEHSALAQCLRSGRHGDVARLVITASGGPFRGRSREQLADVTVAQALAHPTWQMGPVITVNSATLANKGLEVIEAHLLFGFGYDAIEVVVHPQSVVHGLVEYVDGTTIAKLSPPDMQLPIQLALGWPERLAAPPGRLEWQAGLRLDFEPLDAAAFPMVGLAVAAGRQGRTWPGVFNAANEEAVAAFLDGRLAFLGIPAVVEAVLEEHEAAGALDLDSVLAAEAWARQRARALSR